MPDKFRQSFFPDLPKDCEVCRTGTGNDGSCFFHALLLALNLNDYARRPHPEQLALGRRFRATIVLPPEKEWRDFWVTRGVHCNHIPPSATVRQKFKDYRVWADLWMVFWTFMQLQTNIVFYDLMNNKPYCGASIDNRPDGRDSTRGGRGGGRVQSSSKLRVPDAHDKVVVIAWVNRTHFEPVVIIRPYGGQLIREVPFTYMKNRKLYLSVFSGKLRNTILGRHHDVECKGVSLGDVAAYQGGNNARSASGGAVARMFERTYLSQKAKKKKKKKIQSRR